MPAKRTPTWLISESHPLPIEDTAWTISVDRIQSPEAGSAAIFLLANDDPVDYAEGDITKRESLGDVCTKWNELSGLDKDAIRSALLSQYEAAMVALKYNQDRAKEDANAKKSRKREPIPEQSACAETLASEYQGKVLFSIDRSKWFECAESPPRIWSPIEDEFMQNKLRQNIGAIMPDQEGFSWSYLQGVEHMLRGALGQVLVPLPTNLIPFSNGMLDTNTMTLMEHDPAHLCTWAIPYDYSENATCEPVIKWLGETLKGYEDIIPVVRAFMRAVLLGRVSVQKFLELLGQGGTGKSTFINLLMALVGQENTAATKLSLLETSRFEPAKLAGKRLVVVTDAEKYGGEVTVLKAYTGQDPVPWEEKNNKRLGHFVAEGLVIISANQPVQSADYTSGLERRRLTVSFDRPPKEPRALIEFEHKIPHGEFVEYLPGLVNWALSMPDGEMLRLLSRDGRATLNLAHIKAQTTIETNPLAMWANEKLIYAPRDDTRIGVATKDKFTGQYDNRETLLYPNYCAFMEATNHNIMSLTRFPRALDDLCRAQLKLPDVYRHRTSEGSHFRGIKLRTPADADKGPFVQVAMTAGWRKVQDDDGKMTIQAIESADYVDYADYIYKNYMQAEYNDTHMGYTYARVGESFAENPTYPTPPSASDSYGRSENVDPSRNVDPVRHASHADPVRHTVAPSPQVDNPTLWHGGARACPKCKSTSIDWGLESGRCQKCKFVIED